MERLKVLSMLNTKQLATNLKLVIIHSEGGMRLEKIRYVHTSDCGIRKGNRLYCLQDVYEAFGVI